MCHLNIVSKRKKLDSFGMLMDDLQHDFSLLGVTETWLKNDECALFDIEGYNTVKKHRQNQSCGGVAIYIKDSMEYTVRNDLVTFNEYIESIFIEIDKECMNAKKNIVIGVTIEFQTQI